MIRSRGEDCNRTVREVEMIIISKKFISMSIISTSLTVLGQPSPRFHVEALLPFRNREMDYSPVPFQGQMKTG